jgi:hypothetical protein
MTLTDEDRRVLTLLLVLLFGIGSGVPLGILIGKDGKR